MSLYCLNQVSYRAGQSTLLNEVSLKLEAGEMIGIIGPNGAGKSTLIKLLAGILQPSNGELLFNDKPIGLIPAPARARYIGYLQQSPQAQWPLTVEHTVGLGRLPYGDPERPENRKVIKQVLKKLDLESIAERNIQTLSGGEQMRVFLGRVLAGEPSVILADEPTTGLDPRHAIDAMNLLKSSTDQGNSVITVLHDVNLAMKYCHKIIMLKNGPDGSQASLCKASEIEQFLPDLFGVSFEKGLTASY